MKIVYAATHWFPIYEIGSSHEFVKTRLVVLPHPGGGDDPGDQPAWHGGVLWDDEPHIGGPDCVPSMALGESGSCQGLPSNTILFFIPPSGSSKGFGAIRLLGITSSIYFCISVVLCWC